MKNNIFFMVVTIFIYVLVFRFEQSSKSNKQAGAEIGVATLISEIVVVERPQKESEDHRILGVTKVLSERSATWSPHDTFSIAEHIVQEADNIGVQPSLLLAVIDVESSFNACAVSPVGAKGLMQVMPKRILGPKTADKNFAFNHHLVFDPHWNISFGAAYLNEMISRFGSLEMALAAYNRGPTRLSRQLRNRTFRGCSYTRKVIARQEAYSKHNI